MCTCAMPVCRDAKFYKICPQASHFTDTDYYVVPPITDTRQLYVYGKRYNSRAHHLSTIYLVVVLAHPLSSTMDRTNMGCVHDHKI